jgi:tetratricopeptide (TPR) repeat protein
MCSSQTLFGFAALLALAVGCATAGGSGSPKREVLPDEAEAAPGQKSTGGLSAPVEVPLIARKPTDRQVTEEDRADYEKAVADYMKAKKGGTIPGDDCSRVASAFRKLADQVPALLEARSNEAAVYLECGKKGDAVSIWKKLTAAGKPFAPALANLGYVSWQEGNKSDAESLFKRSIEADPWSGSIAARINMAQIYRERARLASGSEKKSLNDAAVRNYGAFSRWMGTACRHTPGFASSTSTWTCPRPPSWSVPRPSSGRRKSRPASLRMRRPSRMSRARKPRRARERKKRRRRRTQTRRPRRLLRREQATQSR